MGRAAYTESVTRQRTITVDVSGVPTAIDILEPLDGVEISVYKIKDDGTRDTVLANIFTSRDPSNNTAHPNPFVTPAGGKVNFWANPGDYDILFHDTETPARIGDQSVGFQALGGGLSGIASTQLPEQGRRQWDPGDLLVTARGTLKPGFLWCDGSLLVRADNQALFDAIGTAYNTGGEAATHFRIPDYRGRVPVGADNMGSGAAGRLPNTNRAIGQSHGTEQHALTAAQTPLKSHTHSGVTGIENQSLVHSHGTGGGSFMRHRAGDVSGVLNPGTSTAFVSLIGVGSDPITNTANGGGPNHTHNITTGNPSVAEANGSAHPNIQPGQVCHVQIKT